jgi:DNA repair exonuclease SbcCD ATPase subunit
MKIPAIIVLIWFGIVAMAAAQGGPVGKGSSQDATQAQLTEIRSVVHELEARTEKLHELMEQYRSMVEQRPQGEDAKWNAALDRLLHRIDDAHAAVVETTQRLHQASDGRRLPTALGKDVANALNEAGAQRTAAEQALAKNKGKPAKTAKPAKQAPAPAQPGLELPDDI